MRQQLIYTQLLITTIFYTNLNAQYSPLLSPNDTLPIQQGSVLVFDSDMSDEFNAINNNLNPLKWKVSDPPNTDGWHGRFPGHFDADAVSVAGGSLRIEASLQSKTLQDYDGIWKTFTHQGGMVTSVKKGSYGYYEARIKANKTFMSSTFWLISEDCSQSARGTELDILETFGIATINQQGITTVGMENFAKRMNCNTHGFNCPGRIQNIENGTGSFLDSTMTHLTSENYHTYGGLWLNDSTILFYLDGKKIGEVVPPADFDLGMYIKMVVETYNWNQPDPGNDGMGSNLSDRTTYYDYVRVWQLKNDSATIGILEPFSNTANMGVAISPNPITSMQFNIEINASKLMTETFIVLYSAQGVKLFDKIVSNHNNSISEVYINLDHLSVPNGIYFLKIKNGHQEVIKSIIIQQ